jgi:hypothetical protein
MSSAGLSDKYCKEVIPYCRKQLIVYLIRAVMGTCEAERFF